MYIARVSLDQAAGHLLLHNVVDTEGRRLVRKGVQLTSEHIARLRQVGLEEVEVAVLEPGDVQEDEAARRLASALQTPELFLTWGVGGRANLHSEVLGVLYVDVGRLQALNQLPGITLATLPQHSVVRPERRHGQVATLKVIPYAVPEPVLVEATHIAAGRPGILEVRPLRTYTVALLITGHPAALPRLRAQFEPAVRQRLQELGSRLATVTTVEHAEKALRERAAHLLAGHDMLVVTGQTSVMDLNDLTLRVLRAAGAEVVVHGAPVDPGNLLALAYLGPKPILCAPGCARSLARNVVDLVLPRLLVGERLTREDVACLGLGGLLHEEPTGRFR